MTSELTETQRAILTAACARRDGAVFPITTGLKGGAIGIVLKAMLKRGLVEQAEDRVESTLVTAAAYEALGIERQEVGADTPVRSARAPRENSKQALLISMLRREEGATVPEIIDATDWQAHTVRGAMAGALKKRFKLEIVSEKVEGRGRMYRAS